MSGYSRYYPAFAGDLLAALGVPFGSRDADVPALVAWIGGEAGWSGANVAVTGNNPLNIKTASFRSYGIATDGNRRITNVDDGTQGYGTFTTRARGAAATAAYLSVNAHGYPAAIAELRHGHARAFLDAIAKSDWAASHYGMPRTNHLLDNLRYVLGTPDPAPVPQPPAQPAPGDVGTFDLVPITCRRVVTVPPGAELVRPDGEHYTTIARGVELGLILATADHYLVTDGDRAVFVLRSTPGLSISTADLNAGA